MRWPGKMTALALCAGWLAWAAPGGGLAAADDGGGSPPTNAVTPNEFEGSDAERINRAIEVAAVSGRRVVIPHDNVSGGARSELWLLDSAILLRSNTTLELDNCRIKLSDRCRDNLMRNVKVKGVTTNLHVRGLGTVVLEGADHPRSTGFGGWALGKHTYGTDGGVAGEIQGGDARNYGLALTSVEDFSLENFTIRDSHAWAICLQQCVRGTLRDLGLASLGYKMIDGVRQRIVNQDGIDLRSGCHDILIENLAGHTGDDMIALTCTSGAGPRAGDRADIHHVTMRNIRGYSAGACQIIRLLNNRGAKIHDILIDGLTDTTPDVVKKGDLIWGPSRAAVKIGDTGYGGIAPVGDTCNVTIRNVTSRARYAILIAGSLSESSISNVVHYGTNDPVTVTSPEYVRDVTIENARKVSSAVGPVAD